jgi:hypothetical protein
MALAGTRAVREDDRCRRVRMRSVQTRTVRRVDERLQFRHRASLAGVLVAFSAASVIFQIAGCDTSPKGCVLLRFPGKPGVA